MHILLDGRSALITASTRGIGFAIAKMLGNAGANLIINGRTEDSVNHAVEALSKQQIHAQGIVADVGTKEGCQALISSYPRVDILINNAAFIGWADILDTDDEIWQQAWDTNVMAAQRLSRHYLPSMLDQQWGRLIFISSESARNVQPDLIPYGCTKLALHALSRGMAKKSAGTGVTSNVILPGPTLSDGARDMLSDTVAADQCSYQSAGENFVKAFRPSSIIQRMATVDEVASMVTYICSPQAAATTGTTLRVDGGVVDDIH